MFRSLLLYIKYFIYSAFLPGRKIILRDFNRYLLNPYVFREVPSCSKRSRNEALVMAIDWLLLAQKKMMDKGFGSFHLVEGWSTSYP